MNDSTPPAQARPEREAEAPPGLSPAISILLAVYNGAEYLDAAIKSIEAQTFGDWELIVVSNGSTDRTLEVCAEAAARDSRVRFFTLEKKNKNAAYNLAFANSRGRYVCYFAADDVLPPESLASRVAVLGNARDEFSTCCLKTISQDPQYDGLVFPKNRTKPNFAGGSMLFPRELADRVFPLPEGQPNEDTWTLLHLRAFGRVRHVAEPLYYYRIHGNNSYGYGLSFEEKRDRYLRRMHAFRLFAQKVDGQGNVFVRREVLPFIRGLDAAERSDILGILRTPGLDWGRKALLVFYCSAFLYKVRYRFFRLLSGGVAR